jgi:L-ascorbate metabolism protein UlaG (beta-lactamase superfamily)
MDFTKLGHSCWRVESGGTTLVIDPGGFSDPDALDGADAVLVTHEHADHVVPDRLVEAARANRDLEVWTNEAVAAALEEAADGSLPAGWVHVVNSGDTFTVGSSSGGTASGGIDIEVHGEKHATIHPDLPLVNNVGFLLPGGVFHPGDALTVPETRVATLLAPAAAPWLKVSELIDWLRAVDAGRAYLMHDAILSDVGLGLYERVAGQLTSTEVRRVTNGEPFAIG